MPELVNFERNLASLGFFTPSSKLVRRFARKTVSFFRVLDGSPVESFAEIQPSPRWGLPVTADQDKYLALLKLIASRGHPAGEIRNPIIFTSAELLRVAGCRVAAGKNYLSVGEWLHRMSETWIEGPVYFAGGRCWQSGRFRVFERAAAAGSLMSDGSRSSRNRVWLSDWHIENLNHDYVTAIDLDAYRKLRTRIARTIVPPLQIWLASSPESDVLEERYEAVCRTLRLRQYRQISRIREKLAPSLADLEQAGYLTGWEILEDDEGFRVVFHHGGGGSGPG